MMISAKVWTTHTFVWRVLLVAAASIQQCRGDISFDATWKLPSSQAVDQQLFDWLQTQSLGDSVQREARREFSDRMAAGSEVLTALVHALGTSSEQARALVAGLETAPPHFSAYDSAWLESAEGDRFDVRHFRLYVARALNEARQHDEALRWLQGIEPHEVVCPDVLLFQRAVAHHQLVHPDEALDAIDELLRCESPLPARYVRLASIMRADLEPLQADSLDHIGRRMSDVERRLDIGQVGEKTTQLEESIIASLDKLIQEAEEEQERRMQQQQQSAPAQPVPSSVPQEDSRIAELKGPGKVDPRRLGEDTQWGSLPPQERERIMQQLGRDFPAHYREVIEEYFRKLASEKENAAEQP